MNYKHIYLKIIRNAKNEEFLGKRPTSIYYRRHYFKDNYFEFHHILPKSIFPEFIKLKKNLIALTAKEHFICHKLLTKIYPSREMSYALLRLCNKRKNMYNISISANEYEKIRLNVSKYQSEYMKNHIVTEEQRIKLSNSLKRGYSEGKYIPHNKNNNLSADTKEKISNNLKEQYKTGKIETWNKNKKCSKLAKIKEDNWMYGKHWYNNGKINKFCYECPEGFVKGFLDPRWVKDDANTR